MKYVLLKDCDDDEVYGMLTFGKKINIEEVQEEIYRLKNAIEGYCVDEILDGLWKKYDFAYEDLHNQEYLEV